jgi:hypothetical protein
MLYTQQLYTGSAGAFKFERPYWCLLPEMVPIPVRLLVQPNPHARMPCHDANDTLHSRSSMPWVGRAHHNHTGVVKRDERRRTASRTPQKQ